MHLSHSHDLKTQQRAGQLAHATIRSLLNGSSPAALTQPGIGPYGSWGPTIERLFLAHAEGGTSAVAEAYGELHRADERLIALMGSAGKSSGNPAGVSTSGHTPPGSVPIVTLADLLAAQRPPTSSSSNRSCAWGSPASPAGPRTPPAPSPASPTAAGARFRRIGTGASRQVH